jgi:hypothetical protein
MATGAGIGGVQACGINKRSRLPVALAASRNLQPQARDVQVFGSTFNLQP